MVSPRIVDDFDKACFARGLSPLASKAISPRCVLGFDTEYTQTGALVCYTLSYKGKGKLFDSKLTLSTLVASCRELVTDAEQTSTLHLVTFFSVAELQHLPVFRKAKRVRYFGGSVDIQFEAIYGATVYVFDLARFFPQQTLAMVAPKFGLKKHKVRNIEAVTKASLRDPKFRKYAIHDAVLVDSIYSQLQAATKVDLAKHSTPAMAASAELRQRWISEELAPPSPSIRRAALLALHGGRAEAYMRGSVPHAREYDIKSSYPSACVSFGALPTARDWRRSRTVRDSDVGFVECAWEFGPNAAYPSLGQEVESCLLFARGGRGWITADEFRLADSLGARLRVYRSCVAESGAGTTELCDFMSHMLATRSQIGAAGIVAKLAANSVIGKLGQKTRIVDWNGWLHWLRKHVSESDFLEGIQLQSDMIRALGFDGGWSFGSCYCPEWSALILGRARTRISELAAQSEALYVHTDSVWTLQTLSAPDLTLKSEGSCIVARGKVGLVGDHLAHHGIKSRDVARRALELLRDKMALPDGFNFERPVRFREWTRIGGRLGRWVSGYKKLGFEWDNKRRLLSDGTTEPWKSPLEFVEARKLARTQKRLAND